MQKDVLHIKPNSLSKATQFLQGYAPKYPNGKYQTISQEYGSRSKKLQEMIESLNVIPINMSVRTSGSGIIFSYKEKILDAEYSFMLVLDSTGSLDLHFSRNNESINTSHTRRREDVIELRRALSIITSMLDKIIRVHGDKINEIVFASSGDKAARASLYSRIAMEIGRRYGGNVTSTFPGEYRVRFHSHPRRV